MAQLTSARIRTTGKLSGMRIGVANGTAGELRDLQRRALRPLPSSVALLALYRGMASEKRELRAGMIETSGGHLVPPVRRVAAFAGFLKSPAVRIAMAGGTGGKLQSGKMGGVRCIFPVTFFALYFLVQAGQVELRHIVVVLRRRLPSVHRVATEAAPAELSAVRVGVTRLAFAGKAKVGTFRERRSVPQNVSGPDVLAPVALPTRKLQVSSQQGVPDCRMVER